jgi:YidC/Oxa1 family membrane protein insertase
MLSPLGGAVSAAYHVVSAFAQVLAPVAGGLATAAAIVMFTMAVRLLLLPLSYYSIRGQAIQARLLPQIQELQKRHAGHPDRLQRELAALQAREGAGMLAGCLPTLLQLPFLSVMYQLFRSPAIGGQHNSLLSHELFGVPLGHHWLSAPGLFSAQGAVFLGLFALLAAVAWAGTLIARRVARPSPSAPARPAGAMGALLRVLPYATVAVAAVLPLAAGLYLLTTTAWSAAERAVLGRRLHTGAAPDPGRPALA